MVQSGLALTEHWWCVQLAGFWFTKIHKGMLKQVAVMRAVTPSPNPVAKHGKDS